MQSDQFEDVFQRHFNGVHGVVARLVGDPDEAEDLTLEAFWRLWRTPGIDDGSCGPWLYRVATRLGYNALRARTRRSSYEQAAGEDDWRQEGSGNPEGETERRIERQRVRAALRALPFRQTQVLSLRMSGMSYREVAAAMGVKASSIGALLARAESHFEEVYLELVSTASRSADEQGGSHARG